MLSAMSWNCFEIKGHLLLWYQWAQRRERAKYNRSDCAEDPFRGTDTESVMSAVHHLGGMLNGLVLIDTLDSLILSHAQTHTCNLWLMRPGAGDGSIKEPPPPPFSLSFFPSPVPFPFKTCTWLIAVIWAKERKWEIEKWRREIGNNVLIINSEETKGPSPPRLFS